MKRPLSIAFTVIASLVAVTTLLMVLAAVLGYRAIERELRGNLRRTHVTVADQLAVALALPVWNFDYDQIERIKQSVIITRDVESINVTIDHRDAQPAAQRLLAVRPVSPPPPAPALSLLERLLEGTGLKARSRPDFYRLSRPIQVGDQRLGTVQLEVSTRLLEERLWSYRIAMITLTVAVDALIVTALYGLLWRLVIRPLRLLEGVVALEAGPNTAAEALQAQQFRGELERLRRALVEMTDLLRRRHAELEHANATLEAEKTKLRTLLDIVPVGIAITDLQRNVREGNRALERMLGLPPAEARSTRLVDLKYQDANGTELTAENLPAARAIREQRELVNLELSAARPDGSKVWLLLNATPLSAHSAAVTAVDITERRHTAERLQLQLDELKRWQTVTLDREDRLRQLKTEINDLCRRLNFPPRYQVQEPMFGRVAEEPADGSNGGAA